MLLLLGASAKPLAAWQENPKYAASETGVFFASPGKDEDPSVLRAKDGRMFVAWFSERSGNADIWVTATRNGSEWLTPVRVTTSPDGDFAPSLYQDDAGVFHLVWFRWFALFRGSIWYNHSKDGLAWDPANEVQVTLDPGVDDWVPTITGRPDGSLLVYFVSAVRSAASDQTNNMYLARRLPDQMRWEPPVLVEKVSSPTAHDHLPSVARTGDLVSLVWTRSDVSQPIPWLSPRSELMFASSPDGLSWGEPVNVTQDAFPGANLFGTMGANAYGEWSLIWLNAPSPTVIAVAQVPLAQRKQAGASVRWLQELGGGYSHKLSTTPTPGIHLAVWVAGPDGAQDIYYRFIEVAE